MQISTIISVTLFTVAPVLAQYDANNYYQFQDRDAVLDAREAYDDVLTDVHMIESRAAENEAEAVSISSCAKSPVASLPAFEL